MDMNPEHILVVDDEPALCDLMVAHLTRNGYNVSAAGDGQEALDMLRAEKNFAVLVTDLAMPRMSGLDLLREARRLDPRLEVLVISANDTAETAIAAMREYGAYDYLRKPLDPLSELSLAVSRAVSYRRLCLEREALQAHVAAEAQRLQILIANTNDAILSADAQGILRVANPAAARLLGQDELIGVPAARLLTAELTRLVNNWQVVGNHLPVSIEISWSEKTTYTVNLTPIPGSQGRPEGWVMVLHDITHLKQLDELQLRLLTDMARKIQLPLMQSFALLADISQEPEVRAGRSIDSVYRLGKLLDRIREWMDEVLIAARVEAGTGLHPSSLNVTELVHEWAHTFNEKRGQDKSVRLVVAAEQDLPPVCADRELMHRLLQQAVGQAVDKTKANSGGEIRLSVDYRQGQVWIGVTQVTPPAEKGESSRLLAKYGSASKIRRSTKELNMVKAIVNRMGGQVWVRGPESLRNDLAICLPAMTRPDRE
jgi:PAS domain S-box-containing protein